MKTKKIMCAEIKRHIIAKYVELLIHDTYTAYSLQLTTNTLVNFNKINPSDLIG